MKGTIALVAVFILYPFVFSNAFYLDIGVALLLLPFYFCMINAATFFGAYHALTSRRRMAWK